MSGPKWACHWLLEWGARAHFEDDIRLLSAQRAGTFSPARKMPLEKGARLLFLLRN
jgi:hypothetical protein